MTRLYARNHDQVGRFFERDSIDKVDSKAASQAEGREIDSPLPLHGTGAASGVRSGIPQPGGAKA